MAGCTKSKKISFDKLANTRKISSWKISKVYFTKRKFPFDHKIVGRANWFTLTTKAVKYILDFLDKNPAVIKYYKYCWGADEFIFSTILYNSSFQR